MGNSNSSESVDHAYNDYLNKQKNIIMAQQEQINKLTMMNIKQNIINSHQLKNNNIPPNIQFNQNNNNQFNQNNNQNNNQNQFQIEDKKKNRDPYKILGIDKNYDEKILKKAYIRMAIKTHPDKGGNADDFQKVSIAYTVLLKKLNDMNNNHSHFDMKNVSKDYYQNNQGEKNIKLNDKFDCNLFNKIYDENRIDNVFDDGYGDWMKKNEVNEKQKMFNGKFNKDMFNREFTKCKKKQNIGKQLMKYNEPINDISFKGKDQLMDLGSDKIDNFSGEGEQGLKYRDYRDAFTNTCLIDTDEVKIKGRSKNLNDIKSQRGNIQYEMNDSQKKKYEKLQKKNELNEMMRLKRLNESDNYAFNQYDRIHQRMLN
tara:strand:- start:791 stop:1900 length:1110 start_codon:yes stop_codon:yes gene_type:complete